MKRRPKGITHCCWEPFRRLLGCEAVGVEEQQRVAAMQPDEARRRLENEVARDLRGGGEGAGLRSTF